MRSTSEAGQPTASLLPAYFNDDKKAWAEAISAKGSDSRTNCSQKVLPGFPKTPEDREESHTVDNLLA
jgi:hypothetical protein